MIARLSPTLIPVHSVLNGRIRYRFKPLRYDDKLKNYIETKLNQYDNIYSVEANTNTTSLLITYAKHLSSNEILKFLENVLVSYFQNIKSDNPEYFTQNLIPKNKEHITKQNQHFSETSWHVENIDLIAKKIQTSLETGLTTSAVQERLEKIGPNTLQAVSKRSGTEILLSQFKSLPIALLSLSAGISLATGGIITSGVILAVVVANVYISYAMENSSERIISQLANIGPTDTFVIRDGQKQKINISEITVGDLILLTPGNYVPADARIILSENLYIDESALTGESILVEKKSEVLIEQNLSLADRTNMAYRGTIIMSGSGLALVTAVGEETEIGKIQTLVAITEVSETPMQKQMARLSNKLISVTGLVGVGLFVIGMTHGYGFLSMLNMSIALIVAAIPEGIPTVTTTTLTQSTRKMRSKNVIVRKLDAIETLGCVQVLCLDKTGTLTMNQMSTAAIYTGFQHFAVADNKIIKSIHNTDFHTNPNHEIYWLMRIATLCNEGSSSTENAYLDLAKGFGINIAQLKKQYPIIDVEYRAAQKNYMITKHTTLNGILNAIKGNPAEVLELCDFYLKEGEKKPLNKSAKNKFLKANHEMCEEGLRVLGFAFSEMNFDSHVEFGHTFIGLVGLVDLPRPGVKEFIQTAHASGIKTIMITGDQAITATALARQLNLSGSENLKVFDASKLHSLEPRQFLDVAKKTHVFARVSPEDKLHIVQAIKKTGSTVAMVGDGVNDAPALKAADVSIAMGKNGTEIAREVANVVLLDDRLDTLITAVAHGRATYDAIQKSSKYLLTTSLCELFIMSASIGFGLGQPLNPQQLLWINLVIDILPAIALAMEPPDTNILNKKPRHPNEEIIDKKNYQQIAAKAGVMAAASLGSYMIGALRSGFGGPHAQSFAFMTIIASQFIHALSATAKPHEIIKDKPKVKNKYIVPAVAIGVGMQIMAFTIPGLRTVLGITVFGITDYIVCFVAAGINYTFDKSVTFIRKTNYTNLLKEDAHVTIYA